MKTLVKITSFHSTNPPHETKIVEEHFDLHEDETDSLLDENDLEEYMSMDSGE